MIAEAQLIESITLRDAVVDDSSFLAQLYSNIRRDEVRAWGWPPEQQERFLLMQFEAQRRSYQEHFSGARDLIVLRDSVRVGRILTSWDGPSLRLIDIALIGEHRRQGIGTFLLDSLLEECRARDCVLRLQVLQGNPAIRLYERLGFIQVSNDQIYLQMEWKPSIQKAAS